MKTHATLCLFLIAASACLVTACDAWLFTILATSPAERLLLTAILAVLLAFFLAIAAYARTMFRET
jgi:hypothetical protein